MKTLLKIMATFVLVVSSVLLFLHFFEKLSFNRRKYINCSKTEIDDLIK